MTFTRIEANSCGVPQSIEVALRGTRVDDDVPAINIAKVAQTLPEVIPEW